MTGKVGDAKPWKFIGNVQNLGNSLEMFKTLEIHWKCPKPWKFIGNVQNLGSSLEMSKTLEILWKCQKHDEFPRFEKCAFFGSETNQSYSRCIIKISAQSSQMHGKRL